MARIEELNDAPIRIVYDEAGAISDLVDARGNSLGFVFSKLNAETNKTFLSSGGVDLTPEQTFDDKLVASLDASFQSSIPSGFTFGRASAQTYLAADGLIKSAASGVPAFEFDAAGNALGLLFEPAATNLALYSADMSNAAWVGNQTTRTSLQAAPDGTNSAQLLTETSGTAYYKQTVAISAGQCVTFSKSFKRGNWDWVRMTIAKSGAADNRVTAWFNLATGQATTVRPNDTGAGVEVPTGFGSKIVALPNGFFRCFVWGVIPSATSVECSTFTADDDAKRFISATGRTRIEWGAQIIAAAQPDTSSYIPTTSAAVARAACSLSSAAPWYEKGGALIVGYKRTSPINSGLDACIAQLDDGTTANILRISSAWSAGLSKYAQTLTSVVASGAAQTATLSPISAGDASVLASSINYDTTLSHNGRVGKDYYITSPAVQMSRLTLGAKPDGSSPFTGYIKSVKFVPSRLSEVRASAATSVSTAKPITAKPTDETSSLYRYISELDGQFFMGHQWQSVREVGGSWQVTNAANYPTGGNEQVITRLLTQAGHAADYPVMMGIIDQEWRPVGDLGGNLTIDSSRTDITDIVKAWFRAGRIVTMCTDMPNFVGPTTNYPKHVSMYAGGDNNIGALTTTTGENASYCMRRIAPGGDLQYKLDQYLDSLCKMIDTLVVDGIKIPIILRLFRESRMGVFWWNIYKTAPNGQQYVPDDVYVAVYRHAVDYIKARCPNVLFNFCMGAPSPSGLPGTPADGMDPSWYYAVYPGDAYTDFVTVDPYNNSSSPPGALDDRWMGKSIDCARYLAGVGSKPFGFGEIGFYWSAQNWVAASATTRNFNTANGYANPTSFWDGVVLEHVARRGQLPKWMMWWGEGGAPYSGCPASPSAVEFLRSPQCLLASDVSRRDIYGF